MRKPTVFISHSRRDVELVDTIKKALENIQINTIIEEFEKDKLLPDYREITQNVRMSDFVFLFLTDNVVKTEHTKNWIIFEVGVASAFDKNVFVFERKGTPINYPIPYLTDYMIFDEKSTKDILEIQSISAKLAPIISNKVDVDRDLDIARDNLVGLAIVSVRYLLLRRRMSKLQLPSIDVICTNCKTGFSYYSKGIPEFLCPLCRGSSISIK